MQSVILQPLIRTILVSAAKFIALSLLPKLLIVAKDIMVAFYFGTGDALDTFLMAFVLIAVPVSIIVVALQTTLIPALVGKSGEAAAYLLGGILKLALSAMLLVLPLWLLALPYILRALYPAVPEITHASLLQACYWLIPYFFLNGINLILYGALQAKKTFWINAVLPGVFPIALITVLGFTQQADIRALLIGTVTGSVLECAVLHAVLIRDKAIKWGDTAGFGLRSVFFTALPLMLSGTAGTITPIVEQMIAFNLGTGAVSLLNYGNKLPVAINSLLVTAIGIIVLPYFSDLVSSQQWRKSYSLQWQLSVTLFAVGFIVATVGYIFAEDLIRIFFERGAFTNKDSNTSAHIMKIYLFQLPFLLVSMIFIRALVALGKTMSLTWIAILQLTLVVSLSHLFSRHFGIVGIPAGVVFSFFVGMLLLGYTTWRELMYRSKKEFS